jgi:hypothetical protein
VTCGVLIIGVAIGMGTDIDDDAGVTVFVGDDSIDDDIAVVDMYSYYYYTEKMCYKY